jgi:multiple sugar transport system substrate-binding protein
LQEAFNAHYKAGFTLQQNDSTYRNSKLLSKTTVQNCCLKLQSKYSIQTVTIMGHQNSRTLSRRQFLKLSAVAGGGFAVAASGVDRLFAEQRRARQDVQTVVVMYQRNEFSEDAQAEFEAANPDIRIEFLENDQTRLFAMYAAGNPPDLFRVQAPDIPQLIGRGMLYDLTPYFESSSVLRKDDLAPANRYYMAEDPFSIGSGKIYGMAKDWSPDFTLYINTRLFEENGIEIPDPAVPLNYAQIAEYGERIRKMDGQRVVTWGYGYAHDMIDRLWMNMLAETGQKLYSDDFTRIILADNAETRDVIRYYYDLAEKNITLSPINPTGWIGTDFNAGTLGIIQYGYWFSPMAESDTTKGDVLMLPGPVWKEQRTNPTITATGTAISSATRNPDAAWRVFEWFNGGSIAESRFSSGWGVPSLVSKYELLPQESDFQQQAYEVLQAELPYADASLQFNPYLSASAIPPVWSKYLESALRGEITFDDLLTSMENEINLAIQDGIDRLG